MSTPDLGAYIVRLNMIEGVVGIASKVVFEESGTNDELTRAWCALDLALKEIASLRRDIDNDDLKQPTPGQRPDSPQAPRLVVDNTETRP